VGLQYFFLCMLVMQAIRVRHRDGASADAVHRQPACQDMLVKHLCELIGSWNMSSPRAPLLQTPVSLPVRYSACTTLPVTMLSYPFHVVMVILSRAARRY
jgi:hypothetical protein